MKRRMLLLISAVFALAACEPGPDPQDETRLQMVGTWLREFEEGGFKIRRVLVVEQRGKFHESTLVTDAEGTQKRSSGEGDWFFDGTMFKRKYTHVDGGQLSGGRITFATFQVTFPSRAEFVGVDNVRKIRAVYRRVPEGTTP